jgi:hypothetical protein
MFQKNILISCAGAANTIYLPLPYPCTLLSARWTANADTGANHSVVISKNGGNTIISGDVSATPGAVVKGTLTATVADQRQAMDETTPLKLVITLSNAAIVGLCLDLSPFKQNPEA